MPPVAESGAVLELLMKNRESLLDGVAVVGEGDKAHGGWGQEWEEVAGGTGWGKLEMLEFFG